MLDHISLQGTASESRIHKLMKVTLSNKLSYHNQGIEQSEIEKYFGRRFADLYIKFKNGKEIVVEVQNSKISVDEIKQRTKHYNQKGIYVLWILNGLGSCCFFNKFSKSQARLKVSPAELYLHRMYGGRVYYLNLKDKKGNEIEPTLFALHFSKTTAKKYRAIYHTQFGSYYIRDTYVKRINDFRLLLTNFANHKIARFYDKNVKNSLVEKILSFIYSHNIFVVSKRVFRKIVKRFRNEFGKYFIYKVLIELHNSNKIKLTSKVLKKLRKNLKD